MAEFDKAINYGTDVIMNYDRNAVDDLEYINLKEKIINEKINNIDYEHDEQTRIINPLFEPNHFISEQINYGEKNKIKQIEFDPYINYLNQKDAIYRHRLVLWDTEFNMVGTSKPFSFLDGNIEFCVGMAKQGEDLLVSFGFQDNAAFVLRVPKAVVEDLILEALEG